MSKTKRQAADPGIEEIREVRRHLVEQHGGLEGWGRHLQEVQAQVPPGKLVRRKKPKTK